MDKCSDPRFERMLHAYELGLITDSDRDELEMHLIECEYCFKKIQNFERESKQIREHREMREFVRKVVSEQEEKGTDTEKGLSAWFGRIKWRRSLPAFAVAAIIILAFVFWPGNLELLYTDKAVAIERRLAIFDFDDSIDPESNNRLGEIAANLLITDLSESQYISVLSRQRMDDILRLQGYGGTRRIEPGVALEVAEKANAKWLLTGAIVQKDPNIVLASQLVDATTGDVIASQKISGDGGEDMFSLIDRLAVAVKDDLSLPKGARSEPNPAIADMTTHSEEAYRLYLVGLDYKSKFLYENARESFKNALAIDSTIAMAYYHLSWIEDGVARDRAIGKAVEFSDKVGWKNRFYINGRQAFLNGDYLESIRNMQAIIDRAPDEKEAYSQIGFCYDRGFAQYDSALVYLKKAVALDSLYGPAFNEMAYIYDKVGNLDKAIWAADQYIASAPGEFNPYDSKGEILANNGKIAEAIGAYEKAIDIDPDQYHTLINLGVLYVLNRQYDQANHCFRKLAAGDNFNYRIRGRNLLPTIPLYQGKYEEALRVLDDTFAADRLEKQEHNSAAFYKSILRLYILYLKGDYETGLAVCNRLIEMVETAYPEYLSYAQAARIHFLVKLDRLDQARDYAEEMRKDIETRYPDQLGYYWYSMGVISFRETDFDASVEYFSKAMKAGEKRPGSFGYHMKYSLARAYQEAGRIEEAISLYEEILHTYNEFRLFVVTASVKSHYYLGQAYESAGRTDDAIRQYREFIDIRHNADNGGEFVKDARRRLSELGG